MGGIALGSVAQHSKATGKALRLLLLLADGAGGNFERPLLITVAPNQDDLGVCLGVAGRYVRTLLAKLYELGELRMVRKGTQGVGSSYEIMLPLPSNMADKVVDNGADLGNVEGVGLAGRVAGLEARMDVVEAKLDRVLVLLEGLIMGESNRNNQPEQPEQPEQVTGTTGTSNRNSVVEESVVYPLLSPSIHSIPPIIPLPEGDEVEPFGFVDLPEGAEGEPSVADRRVAMIAEVCGKDLGVPDHRRRCERAAAQVAGYSPEEIWWVFAPAEGVWYVADWRGMKGQRPTVRELVSEISVLLAEPVYVLSAGGGGSAPLSKMEQAAVEYAQMVYGGS